MSHPITDVVVLTHNRLSVTKLFIEAISRNTDEDSFRLIFVDNASTDGTREYLIEEASKNRWHFIPQEENLGVIGGRNVGAQAVEAEYFVNLDNDQFPEENWLQILHDRMSQGYDIVGCEAWRMTSAKPVSSPTIAAMRRPFYPYYRCTVAGEPFHYIGCGGMLIRKKVYEIVGIPNDDAELDLFDPRFNPAYFEDPDLCWRAIVAGFKLAWEPKCRIKHLAHQTIGTQRLFDKGSQFQKSWLAFREKWKTYHPGDLKTEGELYE